MPAFQKILLHTQNTKFSMYPTYKTRCTEIELFNVLHALSNYNIFKFSPTIKILCKLEYKYDQFSRQVLVISEIFRPATDPPVRDLEAQSSSKSEKSSWENACTRVDWGWGLLNSNTGLCRPVDCAPPEHETKWFCLIFTPKFFSLLSVREARQKKSFYLKTAMFLDLDQLFYKTRINSQARKITWQTCLLIIR